MLELRAALPHSPKHACSSSHRTFWAPTHLPLLPRSGDRELGLNSLPVAFGIEKAKWICAASIDVTQLGVAAYLAWGLNEPYYAAGIAACLAPQVRPCRGGVCSSFFWPCLRRDEAGRPIVNATAVRSGRAALRALMQAMPPRRPPPQSAPHPHTPIHPQVYAQVRYFLPDPVANDVKYQATAQPFLVIGLLVTALAIGHQATPVALG